MADSGRIRPLQALGLNVFFRGCFHQHQDGCAHGLRQSIPGVDDGGQVRFGLTNVLRLGGELGGIREMFRGVSCHFLT